MCMRGCIMQARRIHECREFRARGCGGIALFWFIRPEEVAFCAGFFIALVCEFINALFDLEKNVKVILGF